MNRLTKVYEEKNWNTGKKEPRINLVGGDTIYPMSPKKTSLVQSAIAKLYRYEETGLDPEEILTGVQLAEIACMQIQYKKMKELLRQAAEEIEDYYGMETELSAAIRKQLD